MVKVRKAKKDYVVIVSQKLIRDDRLSWKARGIFAYLWSQADEWDFSLKEVSKHATDGINALRVGVNELEKFGYLTRKRKRNNRGQLTDSEWVLSETPTCEKPTLENRTLENHTYENRTYENPTYDNCTQSNHQPKVTSTEGITKGSSAPLPPKGGGQAGPDNGFAADLAKAKEAEKAEKREQAKEVIRYLNEKAGKRFSLTLNKSKENLVARLNDGYTVDDCKRVIDNKVAQWKDDPKMDKHLNPTTLFRPSHFDNYLNEQPTKTWEQEEAERYENPFDTGGIW